MSDPETDSDLETDVVLSPTPGATAGELSRDTFDVDGLTWLTDDRDAMVDWDAATSYCEQLTAHGLLWRLPTISELGSIADPNDPDSFGVRIKRPFHDGVRSNWIWSAERDPEASAAALAFDFETHTEVSLAINFNEGAHALCVGE